MATTKSKSKPDAAKAGDKADKGAGKAKAKGGKGRWITVRDREGDPHRVYIANPRVPANPADSRAYMERRKAAMKAKGRGTPERLDAAKELRLQRQAKRDAAATRATRAVLQSKRATRDHLVKADPKYASLEKRRALTQSRRDRVERYANRKSAEAARFDRERFNDDSPLSPDAARASRDAAKARQYRAHDARRKIDERHRTLTDRLNARLNAEHSTPKVAPPTPKASSGPSLREQAGVHRHENVPDLSKADKATFTSIRAKELQGKIHGRIGKTAESDFARRQRLQKRSAQVAKIQAKAKAVLDRESKADVRKKMADQDAMTPPARSTPAAHTMSANQYQASKGVHQPWIAEISPYQYARLSGRQRAAYDKKRAGEWQASGDAKQEWADAIRAEFKAGRITKDTPGLHDEARSVILRQILRDKTEAKKARQKAVNERRTIRSPGEVKPGEVIETTMYGKGAVEKVSKASASVRLKYGSIRIPLRPDGPAYARRTETPGRAAAVVARVRAARQANASKPASPPASKATPKAKPAPGRGTPERMAKAETLRKQLQERRVTWERALANARESAKAGTPNRIWLDKYQPPPPQIIGKEARVIGTPRHRAWLGRRQDTLRQYQRQAEHVQSQKFYEAERLARATPKSLRDQAAAHRASKGTTHDRVKAIDKVMSRRIKASEKTLASQEKSVAWDDRALSKASNPSDVAAIQKRRDKAASKAAQARARIDRIASLAGRANTRLRRLGL